MFSSSPRTLSPLLAFSTPFLRQFFDFGIAGKPEIPNMIKAEHPHPGESVDTTDKELLLVVDCPNESSHLGTHLSDATTIEKNKGYNIEEMNKMIVDGPDSWDPTFHKVKLERITQASQIGPLRL